MVGLMHPHEFGWLGDFISSAMSYFTFEYGFSQFDKDALQRAHADRIIIETSSVIREARATLSTKISSPGTENLLSSSETLLREAEADYSMMNYTAALEKALEARELSISGLDQAKRQLAAVPVFSAVAFVAGLVIGGSIIWFVRKRRMASSPAAPSLASSSPSTASAAAYCLNCGAPLSSGAAFCPQCGRRVR